MKKSMPSGAKKISERALHGGKAQKSIGGDVSSGRLPLKTNNQTKGMAFKAPADIRGQTR